MASPRGVAANIASILNSLKYSMDRTTRLGSTRRRIEALGLDIVDIATINGKLETMRIPMQVLSRPYYSNIKREEFKKRIDYILKILEDLINDVAFKVATEQLPFRLITRDAEEIDLRIISPHLFDESTDTYDVSQILYKYLYSIRSNDLMDVEFEEDQPSLPLNRSIEQSNINISALKKIIPPQKIAPIQFDIRNNKIFINKTPSLAPEEDKNNAIFAKEKLLSNGNILIKKLKETNCDKRLIENLEILQESLTSDDSIIKVGINNISFGIMSAAFKTEMSDAINADLQSHNISINMYAAQFPDWLRFSENALKAQLQSDEIQSVKDANSSIIDYLEDNPHIADQEVVTAFKQLASLLEKPAQVGKRIAFAALRTAENLFSKIFHFSVEFFEQTLKETTKEIQKTAAKTIAVAIVGLAITGATHLSGIAGNMKEFSWLKNAIEIVEKQLRNQTKIR